MNQGDHGSNELQPQGKLAWRTPVLSTEKVVEVTNGDFTPLGDDGQQTTHGVDLGFTS